MTAASAGASAHPPRLHGSFRARDTSWMAQAACRAKPGEWFFPDHSTPGAYNQGKAVCATCPVISTCLAYVQHCDPAAEWDGLWAGLTRTERRRLRSSSPTPRQSRPAKSA